MPRARLIEAWRIYRELHFPSLARKTRDEYTSAMTRALRDLPDPLSYADVLRWHRVALVGYSPGYRNAFLHVLRTVTRKAAYVTGDTELAALVWRVQPQREPPTLPRCPPRDIVARSIEVCRSPAERLFVHLAALAGLRRGEILGLRPEDWEPATGILRVVRQRRSPTRKNNRPHSVAVDDEAMRRELEWTIEHPEAVRSRSGWHRGASEGYLFPWSLRRAENLLERIRRALGPVYLPQGWGWHCYRHWGACELARAGKTVWQIQQWLGDADPSMASWYVSLYRDAPSSVSDLASAATMTEE